jgi:uncharacterized protein
VDAATAASPRRVVLLAHSLAVATAVKWAAGASDSQLNKVAGALLVAATNVEDPDPSFDLVRPFAPMPLKCLPFPTLVVASRTDPRVSFDKATAFAAAWGADLADAGELGHMGNETRLGLWPAGLLMLGRLLEKPASNRLPKRSGLAWNGPDRRSPWVLAGRRFRHIVRPHFDPG